VPYEGEIEHGWYVQATWVQDFPISVPRSSALQDLLQTCHSSLSLSPLLTSSSYAVSSFDKDTHAQGPNDGLSRSSRERVEPE
jgi:hypothetical protein